MVMVYHFAGWSHTDADKLIPPRKATLKFVKAHKVTIIEGTGEDVPAETIDADGLHNPGA
jgi:hypothetical protein